MHDHEKCRRLFEKLSEYIDQELDQSVCEVIERHMQQCEPCQACLSSLKQTVALCRKMKVSAIPDDFSQRLRQMMEQHAQGSRGSITP